mmetsp:Transcript_12205/g.36965  ORF Transcript_12205/g.36965 Transcript_12205/m.36965 type:complete len:310 (+) Transcript_12205:664-1593(+)
MMGIDLFPETVTGVKHLIDIERVLRMKADFVIDHTRVSHQTTKIIGVFHSQVVRISGQVVKLVHVDTVSGIAHDIKHKSILGVTFHMTMNQITNQLDIFFSILIVQLIILDQIAQHFDRHLLMFIIRSIWTHLTDPTLERMRERTMTKVMAQSGNLNHLYIMSRNTEVWLAMTQMIHEFTSQVGYSNAMLVSVVRGSREHKIGGAQLFEISKTLKLGCVNDLHQVARQFDVSVDGIIHDLGTRRSVGLTSCFGSTRDRGENHTGRARVVRGGGRFRRRRRRAHQRCDGKRDSVVGLLSKETRLCHRYEQ